MSRPWLPAIGLLLALCPPRAAAAEATRVDALHYPAWLVRDYQMLPLSAGMELRNGDLVRSGEGSRVRLRLADGSRLSLGGLSRFLVESLPSATAQDPAVSVQLLRGVFQLEPAGRAYRFAIEAGEISAKSVSAHIWGRVDAVRDALCLIDGAVVVSTAAAAAQKLDQALSCYLKPREREPLPVDLVDRQQHRLWLAETELKPDLGIVVADGQWQLVLLSLTVAERARLVVDDFRRRGYAVRLKSVLRNGRTLHRLLLPGFESIDAALAARARIEKDLGIADAWVWKANQ